MRVSRAHRPSSRAVRAWCVAVLAVAAGLVALPSGGPAQAVLLPDVPQSASVIPCGSRSMSQPFGRWGDQNPYFTLPGGDFEATPAQWQLRSGVRLVAENEPWQAVSAGSQALLIPAAGTVQVPSFCADPDESRVRFFYRSPGVKGSKLVLNVTVRRGRMTMTNAYWLSGDEPGWKVSEALVMRMVNHTTTPAVVSFSFHQLNTGAAFVIDDIEVDPWKSL
ncbi:MAG: hypothetical protein U0Q15_20650 [Kineosporiaceae bacterium]